MRDYYVYIMSSKSKVLYTGVTNDIHRRVSEHKQRHVPGFASRYGVTRLVWFESFPDVSDAIACEKKIKGWVRKKKIALIESKNSTWSDLSDDWLISGDPSLRSG